jgi:hypothetical protein
MTIKPFTQQDAKLLIATLGTEDRYQEIGELHEQFPQRLSETVLDFEEFWNQLPDDLADSAIPAVEKQVRTVVDSVQLIDGNRLLRKAWYRNAWRKWAEEPNDQRRDALYPLLTALAQAAGEDPNQALQQRDLCDRLQDAS